MNSPLVSVIILNYNGGQITKNCLNSVLRTDYSPFEVILVDNQSRKKEQETLKAFCQKHQDKIKLLINSRNLGYAGGNNSGVSKAKGKYLVFLNNDTIVPSNWLGGPIKKLEVSPNIAFLQPKIKWLVDKKYFEYAGGAGGYFDFFGYPLVRGRVFGSIEEDIGQYDTPREVFWASGVALFCPRKVFIKLERFDSFFFTHGEEEDLCFRAHRAGYQVVYFPGSQVFHLGAYTGNRNMFRKTFFNHRNHLLLLVKNLKFKELIVVLPLRILMDGLAIFYYLLVYRNYQTSLAVLAANFSFFKNFPTAINRRRSDSIKNFGYPQKPGLVFKGSIVWKYFIGRELRWSEIFDERVARGKLIKIF